MRLFRKNRQPRPEPESIDPAAVAAGLHAFAHDLEVGDGWALESIGQGGEMPWLPEEWAGYPTSMSRRVRIDYFGKTGPGEIPDDVLDEVWTRVAGERDATIYQF